MTSDPDRELATELEKLGQAWFSSLSKAEIAVLRAVSTGVLAVCGPNVTDTDPENDASKGDNWGKDRQVRADLIRRLIVDRRAKDLVDPRGIRIYGALIPDALDLSKVTASFGLTLWHCRLLADANLRDLMIPYLDLQGSYVSSIAADRATVAGYVLLRGFRAEGTVRLLSAQIGGNLECDGATFQNKDKGDASLSMDGSTVKGAVFLRNKFTAEAPVRLIDVKVGGELDCQNATFKNGKTDKNVVAAALNMDGADVKNDVYLSNQFTAEGQVLVAGAQIGGNLDCQGAKFGQGLNTSGAAIKGDLVLTGLVHPDATTINLTNTSVHALQDDGQWPGKLFADGFVYQNIAVPPKDRSRLGWLARQDHFTPQPYRQLAKVLAEEGHDDDSKAVLIEMERKERASSWATRPASLLLRLTIGYGYDPLRAVWELAFFSGMGWLIFRRAHLAGAMSPTDKDAYDFYKQNGAPPPYYPRFSPLIYSVENSLPLVNLGQAEHWQPDPGPQAQPSSPGTWKHRFLSWIQSPRFLRGFLWSLIMLGWLFATLFAAGIAGLVHSK